MMLVLLSFAMALAMMIATAVVVARDLEPKSRNGGLVLAGARGYP